MSEEIVVRIQIGVNKSTCFSMTVPWDSTIEELRTQLREEQMIDPSFGVVLISNGENLKNPDITLYDLGICSDSLIICIISKTTGKDIEALIGNKEKDDFKDLDVVLEADFHARPFGFAVWANEKGENAIVTKVSTPSALNKGIKIGYCVYKVDDSLVFNKDHTEVLTCLKSVACPIRIQFVDCGEENTVEFTVKPLGFTVVQDKDNETNAKVSKVTQHAARLGVKIGSQVVAVDGQSVFGRKHKDIIDIINIAQFPINLTFRRPPKLLVLSSDRMTPSKKRKSKKKKKYAWSPK